MWGQPFVNDLEKEFKVKKMRNKRVFHDLNLRISLPDEFRVTLIDYLRMLDYTVDVNEMTQFDEGEELSKLFRGGRLKPVKSVVKARKQTVIGSKFPVLWKLLLITGLVSLIAFFYPAEQLNKELLFYTFTITLILSGFFYLIKRVIISSIWVKTIGVYDVNDSQADIRLVISADLNKGDDKVFNQLRDEVAELYNLVSRKYLREVKAEDRLIKQPPKSKVDEVLKSLAKLRKDEQLLRDKFINGRVSEPVFNRLTESLKRDQDKLETILDLINL